MNDFLLTGKSALIVEDEMLVLMGIEDMFADLGCRAVTTAATIDQAIAMIDSKSFDLATLDLNLGGDRSYRVADALAEHGIPFAFSTGYGDHGLPAKYASRPVLKKPYNCHQLETLLTSLIASSPPSAGGATKAGPAVA